MNHTPGPWKVFDRTLVGTDDIAVANVKGSDSISDAQDEANARLIAAAPELLAALKHTIAIFSTPSNGVWRVPSEPVLSETMAKIQAAIANAESQP